LKSGFLIKLIFALALTAVLAAMLFDLFSAENINSIEGDFEQIGFVRNENNTGPVKRLYAYNVSDTLWENIEKHANLLPHTKYGTTEVYYFLDAGETTIQLNLNNSQESLLGRENCVAHALKNGMGELHFSKYSKAY
jgi:hypothetical protein